MTARRSMAAGWLVVAALVWAEAARANETATAGGWKAGVAVVKITPEGSMWMAGYAARNKPSEGVAQDLFAKALALEDAGGTRLVVVTTDLIGIPRPLREAVEQQCRQRFGLPREGLLLNASHTHCGPELRSRMVSVYDLDEDSAARGRAYFEQLDKRIVDLVGQAVADLGPAKLHYSAARAGFAMNRRLETPGGLRNSPNRDGPVDHDVPVLRVERDGQLRAVLFGYACHNTTLSFYQFCGDYAGYAQEYLQADHPGLTALFLMGCGGDQNPYPRGTLDNARQHGRALANAVETALLARQEAISGPLLPALETATLEFAPPPSREELLLKKQSPNKYEQRHAQRLLDQLERDGSIRTTYDYPVQVVQLGQSVVLVALAGETVVDYSLRLKRELAGREVWVAGYSNDVFGYVPSQRVLLEGGYEGGGAMVYTSLPGPFAPDVEQRIIETVRKLDAATRQAGR